MEILKFTVTWLIMPLLAIRHKFIGVSGYEIRSDKLPTFVKRTCIDATQCFYTVVESDRYGEWCHEVELYKNGSEKIIMKIEW